MLVPFSELGVEVGEIWRGRSTIGGERSRAGEKEVSILTVWFSV